MIKTLFHVVPAICLGFLGQLILHELGHMLGGLLTGWQLIYLQIFHIAVERNNRHMKCKKVSTCGFQCIMYPDSLQNRALLYTVGGCFLNLITAFTGLAGMLLLQTNITLWLYCWCFMVFGLAFFLMNAIPNTRRICNDGACFKLLMEDAQTRLCHNSQLLTAEQLFDGHTYQQIGKTLICNTPEHACNDVLAYQAVLEYYFWLEADDYEMMNKALSKINMNASISRNVKNIIDAERLYADLFNRIKGRTRASIHQEAYNLDIQKLLSTHGKKRDVHSIRVYAVCKVYDKFRKGDYEEARDIIDVTVNRIKNMECLYSGEAYFCIDQLNHLRKYVVKN